MRTFRCVFDVYIQDDEVVPTFDEVFVAFRDGGIGRVLSYQEQPNFDAVPA